MPRYEFLVSGVRYVTAFAEMEGDTPRDAVTDLVGRLGDLDWDCDRGTENVRIESVKGLEPLTYDVRPNVPIIYPNAETVHLAVVTKPPNGEDVIFVENSATDLYISLVAFILDHINWDYLRPDDRRRVLNFARRGEWSNTVAEFFEAQEEFQLRTEVLVPLGGENLLPGIRRKLEEINQEEG